MVRDYFRDLGFPCERIPAGMSGDRGDLSGIEGWTFQLRCYPNDVAGAISSGLADLAVQQANAGTPYGAGIAKRKGKSDPGEQLVFMELWQFAALLLAMRRANVSAEPGMR